METEIQNCLNKVVLAGWLGAKTTALQKYRLLYESLGWEVIIIIPSPEAVGCSIVSDGRQSSMISFGINIPCMENLASDLYETIRIRQQKLQGKSGQKIMKNYEKNMDMTNVASVIFHAFSNNGCFLFDKFYSLLHKLQQSSKHLTNIMDRKEVESITSIKLVGIVFDSSPCYYEDISMLDAAVQMGNVFGDNQTNESIRHVLKKIHEIDADGTLVQYHAKEYWKKMRTRSYHNYYNGSDDPNATATKTSAPLQIPELYIYSHDDKLAPCDKIKELIQERINLSSISFDEIPSKRHEVLQIVSSFFQSKNKYVQILEFRSSQHCEHMKHHPRDYKIAIASFAEVCVNTGAIASKENLKRQDFNVTKLSFIHSFL